MSYSKIILIFCFCTAILSFSATSQGADWKIFYQGLNEKDLKGEESFNYYYDKESIVRPSKGIVQVLFKTTLDKEGSDELIGKDGSDEAEQYLGHIELNCKSKSYKFIDDTKSDSKASRRVYLNSAMGVLWSNLCE